MPDITPIFDFDNHYYEAEDAFTRHQDKRLRSRGCGGPPPMVGPGSSSAGG